MNFLSLQAITHGLPLCYAKTPKTDILIDEHSLSYYNNWNLLSKDQRDSNALQNHIICESYKGFELHL